MRDILTQWGGVILETVGFVFYLILFSLLFFGMGSAFGSVILNYITKYFI